MIGIYKSTLYVIIEPILKLTIKDVTVIRKIIVIIAIAFLCGCNYISSKFPQSKQLPRQQTCSELKRQLIFNTNANNQQLDTTQQAEMDKLYKKYNCQ